MKKRSTQDFLKTYLTSFIHWIESSYQEGNVNYFKWDKEKIFPLTDSQLTKLFLLLVDQKNSNETV